MLPDAEPHVLVINNGTAHGVSAADISLLEQALPRFTYLILSRNQGKGAALRAGVARSKSAICLFTDIDFPYEEVSVAAVYQPLNARRCEVAVGVRDAAYYQHVPPVRTVISKTLRFCTRHFLHLSVSDTQCGIKGFTDKGRQIFLNTQTDRYLFDLEFLFRAARTPGLRVLPVSVQLKPNIIFSRMNARILLNEGVNLLKIVVRNSRRLHFLRRSA